MDKEYEAALVNFAVALAAYDPAFIGIGASPDDPGDAKNIVARWLRANKKRIFSILCLSSGKPKPSVQTAGVGAVSAIARLIESEFGVAFPAEACANYLILYGLESYCDNFNSA